jgi:transcription elongation GreA/GreB family factor
MQSLDNRVTPLSWCGMSTTRLTVPPNRQRLKTGLLSQLTLALETARVAHQSAVEGATHGEARAENSKDTRGLEQSYVARGQAQRVAELEAAVNLAAQIRIDPPPSEAVTIGSLVLIDNGTQRSIYWLLPIGGGSTVENVIVITPASPIGKALLGREIGDETSTEHDKTAREVVAIW